MLIQISNPRKKKKKKKGKEDEQSVKLDIGQKWSIEWTFVKGR